MYVCSIPYNSLLGWKIEPTNCLNLENVCRTHSTMTGVNMKSCLFCSLHSFTNENGIIKIVCPEGSPDNWNKQSLQERAEKCDRFEKGTFRID